MPAILRLIVRDDSTTPSSTLSPTTTHLLVVLISLLVVGIALVATLFFLRSHRASKQKIRALQGNSQYSSAHGNKNSNHRRLTITAAPYGRRSESVYLYGGSEKHSLISSAASPPQSPIPEIRITFPEEEDGFGKRKSGRVVVVRISEAGGVGLEPYHDEHLPPYQTARDGKFESLDLDRIGGLKELERGAERN
ncbi:hypothetical protein MMC07_001149 [Pseudocyphellaria aurata]|nr:hypothetical protein [Pseudocyphellaria aurata]